MRGGPLDDQPPPVELVLQVLDPLVQLQVLPETEVLIECLVQFPLVLNRLQLYLPSTPSRHRHDLHIFHNSALFGGGLFVVVGGSAEGLLEGLVELACVPAASDDGHEEHERDHAADVLERRPESRRCRLDLNLCRPKKDFHLARQRFVVPVQGRGQWGSLDLCRVVRT